MACRLHFLIFLGLLVALLDIILTTILFTHAEDFRQRFLIAVYQYRFESSMFDLWMFGVARTAILLGGVLGMTCNASIAASRMHTAKPGIVVIFVVVAVMTIIKMLAYTEYITDYRQPWFWTLFGWSLTADVLMLSIWFALSNFKPALEPKAGSVNSACIEEQLLQNPTPCDSSVEKEEEKKKKMKSSVTVGRLLKCSAPDWFILLGALTFMTLSALAQIFIPFYTGQVIDGIAIEKSERKFVRAIIIMAMLSIASSISAGLRGGLFKISMARLNIRICDMLFSSLLKQEVGFYDTVRTGEITSRLTSDTTTMADTLSLNVNIALRSAIQSIGICVFMFRLSWRMSFVTFMGLPIIMTISNVYGAYYKKLSKKVQDSIAEANNVAEETCSSMRTVRSFANELVECMNYRSKLTLTYKLKKKEAVAYAGYMWCTNIFSLSLVVATLYYGGHLVIKNMVTGGNLVSFILYQMQLGYALESMAWTYSGLMQAVGASEKVFEFIDRKPEIQHDTGKYIPKTFEGRLEFQDVCFTYPSRPDTHVLQNVSFHVEPGEVVALVGPSGGGKSTCVNLVEHFYQPTSGQILLDGVPIQDYDHKFLHTKVALVGQEPVLYARPIKDNIAYGLEAWTEEMVVKAAKMANADTFILEMKDKYDTEAGEKGAHVSGGQKQRIAIARALIRNPTILLLDEATSALDAESEHLVQEAIYSSLKGRTVMVIAHRLSTVERADRILVINKGHLVEQGTHQQLLQAGGMYAQLVKRQLSLAFGDQKPQQATSDSCKIDSESHGSFKSVESPSSESDLIDFLFTPTSTSPKFGSVSSC